MGHDVDLTDCRHCHCLAARRIARSITHVYDEKLRPHGLRPTQFSILAALALNGPTPTIGLAEILGLERTTLTRSAALLRRNGWVAFGRSSDARKRPLRLREAGRRKLESAYTAWKEAQAEIEEELGNRNPSGTAGRVLSPKPGRRRTHPEGHP
jgi:DNA-binding MarR family transcriptional regulator